MDLESTISVAKTKMLISFTVTAKLICALVFAYAKCCFRMTLVNFVTKPDSEMMQHRYRSYNAVDHTFDDLKDTDLTMQLIILLTDL